MRGDRLVAALSVAFLGAWTASCAVAADIEGVRALAREKAAAVGLMRDKAANIIATVSQDRMFVAYLNATTQGEGARLRTRIEQALATQIRRFGLREFQLIDRSGALVTYVAAAKAPIDQTVDLKTDKLLSSRFALTSAITNSTVVRGPETPDWFISHSVPVIWHGQAEFVLRAEQDSAAYKRALAPSGAAHRYVVLADQSGQILSDSRAPVAAEAGKAQALSIAGQNLKTLRHTLGGKNEEGSGVVSLRNETFNVSYRAVGDWTVVAVEPVVPPRRCAKNGDRLCG